MNIYVEHVEKDFASLLLKDIQFIHRDKVIKKGKLLLFSIKDFYLTFQLQTNDNKLVYFELPYPFKYTYQNQKMTLSYLQEYFSKGDEDIERYILFCFIKNPSKLYNSEVHIVKNGVD
mgnify:CR=1 FL=1